MAKVCICPSCGAHGEWGTPCAFCGNVISYPRKKIENKESEREITEKGLKTVFIINNKKTSRQIEKSIKDYLTVSFKNNVNQEPASYFIKDYETAVSQFKITAKKIFLPLFHFQGTYEGTCRSNGINALNLYGEYSVYRCANQHLYDYEAIRITYTDDEEGNRIIAEDSEESGCDIEYSDSHFLNYALPQIIRFCESGVAKQEPVKSLNTLKKQSGTFIEAENIADKLWRETKQRILNAEAQKALAPSKCSYVSGKFSDETQHLVYCVIWRVEVAIGNEKEIFFTLGQCDTDSDLEHDYGYPVDFSVDFFNLYKKSVIGTNIWNEYVQSTLPPSTPRKENFIRNWYEDFNTKLDDFFNNADEKYPGSGCILSFIFFGLLLALVILILSCVNW